MPTGFAKVGKRVVLGLLVVYIVSIGWFNITRALTTRNIFDELGYASLDRTSNKVWICPEAFGISRLYPLNPVKYTLSEPPHLRLNDYSFIELQMVRWFPFPAQEYLMYDMKGRLFTYELSFYDDGDAPFYGFLLPTHVTWKPVLQADEDNTDSAPSPAWDNGVVLSAAEIHAELSPNWRLVDSNELSKRSLYLDGVYDARAGMLEVTVSKPDFMSDVEAVATAREYFEGYVIQSFCDATNSFRFSAENPGDVTITYKLRGDL